MKTRLFSVLAVLLLLSSCGGGYNPPEPNPGNPNPNPNGGGNNTSTNTNTPSPIVDFSYTTSHPLYVHFENKSDIAPKYKWDFGDGNTSAERSPTHRYLYKGVYKVTLTIGGSSNSYTYTKNVTVVEPTKCYFSGVVYQKIPKNNEYYNIRCTDDYIFFETLFWYSDWNLLSSANIPFTDMFSNKQQVDFTKTEYVIRLYKNNAPSGKGTQVASWIISPEHLKSLFFEHIYIETENSKVKLLFEWK